MVSHIIVTTPKNLVEAAREEAKAAIIRIKKGEQDVNYFRKLARKPKGIVQGESRCYYVDDGAIRGFGIIERVHVGNLECGFTGQVSSGIHIIIPAVSWRWITPIPYTGFQGFHYTTKNITDAKVIGYWTDGRPGDPIRNDARMGPPGGKRL